MLGLRFPPSPLRFALLRVIRSETLCAHFLAASLPSLPSSPPAPSPGWPRRPPRVPAKRAAATRCQAGAGRATEHRARTPGGPANPVGLGRNPWKMANNCLVLL